MRRNRSQHQSLQFDVAQNDVFVHTDASGGGGLTVGVTGRGEVVETGLEGKLEVGAKLH